MSWRLFTLMHDSPNLNQSLRYHMINMERIVSKGLMLGAAIAFTAIHREHTLYSCLTLSLFGFGTVGHVLMSLGVTKLALYLSIAMPLPSILAAAAVFRPELVPALGYAPVIVAFVLWIIEDCFHSDPAMSCPGPWWESCTQDDVINDDGERTTVRDSTMGVHGSVAPDYRIDCDTTAEEQSLLLRHMWSPGQCRAPSSRLSDISLSSSGLDSLPSSWGTLTRTWFPEFPSPRR